MQILFVSSMAIIAQDPTASRKLFIDTLGLPLEAAPGDDYFHSEKIGGSKHFGVWPLSQAAEACFGTPEWPSDRPIPQASVEFEVENQAAVALAAQELENKGYTLLHGPRTEPWGQTVARLLSQEGAILGISYAPSLHDPAAG
jgi:catechol 2,3-dioxygenase-like lactoylglutathione lyase family enzyme